MLDFIKNLKKFLCLAFTLVWFISVSPVVYSDPFCFSLAENYYEQLYCELKALGKGRELPSFRDFRINDEITQALLLKRPAKTVGINVAMPKRNRPQPPQSGSPSTPQTRASRPSSIASPTPSPGNVTPLAYPGLPDCQWQGARILCDRLAYDFVGNRANAELEDGVLSEGNSMAMPSPPAYQGAKQIDEYLKQAYQVYLQKMLDIGLGGATMHFNKFSYFYHDISGKGVSFNGRFETMYKYLKKDKQSMAVSKTSVPDKDLTLSNCFKASQAIITCSLGNRNYLYVASGKDL